MNKTIIAFFCLIMVGLIGCSDSNIDMVKDGHFLAYPHTTIGKAFAANFDNVKWRVEESKLGTKFVIFTGTINKRLHSLGILRLNEWAKTKNELSGDPLDPLRWLCREMAQSRYRTELVNQVAKLTEEYVKLYKENDQRSKESLDHYGNTGRVLQTDHEYFNTIRELNAKYRPEFQKQIYILIDKYAWPVGGEFMFKWAIDADGTSFSLKEFTGEGLPVNTTLKDILTLLYKE